MRSERSKSSVLLISDDDRMQRMASWILLEDGYYVAVCASVTEAIKQDPPFAPDVILLDARDQLMSNETSDLRAAFSGARITAMHYHGAPVVMHVDAECHLHTPFHADELLQCIRDALGTPVGAVSAHQHD
jgi:CheY-like chemotaxis protein